MRKITTFLVLFLFSINICNAQNKSNPIVFAEMVLGYSNGSSKGITGGATLNYQSKNNLFTYRYLELSENRKEGSFFFLPVYIEVENVREQALMYGKRIIEGTTSYSYSAGIAYVDREFLVDNTNGTLKYDSTQSIGFPFELNIKWFNSEKERYRIYELFPIGKPISFANSLGFKFYGDISKTTFVGLGITFGLGWHKNY
ncbi:hypothetical protein [Flavobacterium sp.]|uniref:hypothetical protein n=1 Tax=Flavobacterium sp. TaxID=239 RepID=UPI0037522208